MDLVLVLFCILIKYKKIRHKWIVFHFHIIFSLILILKNVQFIHCIGLTGCFVRVRVQGRLQDGERAEEHRQQEVRLQRRSAPHFPQTVPTSRRQLRIETLTFILTFCTNFFIKRLFVLSCKVCHIIHYVNVM